jgi:UDP-N-acetylmuramoyl-tripeptide--D-alanyl-D-alanine ligase
MMANIISRYRFRYVYSLVYMLQASEYNIGDYFAWLHRVKDFGLVEKRKKLVKSPKSLLILGLGWILWLVIIVLGIWVAFSTSTIYGYVLGGAVVLASPFLLPYGIVIPLLGVHLIQKPIEAVVVSRAQRTLSRHKALKIAVAGSFGKTSMREILKTVLSEGKRVAAPPRSYNTPLGISTFIKALKGNEEVLIFELGEYYLGDVRMLCKLVKPDIGVITGINEAHLQKFKTLESTARTIFELADFLIDKPVYINGESEFARKNARSGHIIYDKNSVGEWEIEEPHTDLSGTSFTLTKGKEKLLLKSSLLGLHQVGPLAVAAVIAKGVGLSSEQIKAGVLKTKPFDHRLEPKTDGHGVITLDDSYNGNPDGVRAVIAFLASLKGRRFYVTPGLVEMGTRTEAVHRDIGRQLAAAAIEKVVLIKNSVTPHIEQGLKDNQYRGEVLWFDDALTAFAALPHMTIQGDILLLQNDWPDQYA